MAQRSVKKWLNVRWKSTRIDLAEKVDCDIPTQLKAWIDRIAIPGKVFRYGANGPEGLAGGKKVIIATSRGGINSQGPAVAADFQEPYLRTVLGFFGITDIEFVRAEGVAMGAERKTQAIHAARASISAVLAEAA